MGSFWISLMVLLSFASLVGGIAGAFFSIKLGKGFPRAVASLVCGIVLISTFAWLASFRPVPSGQIGIATKNALGGKLQSGDIIALNGEMGQQVTILREGWHSGLWPFIYDVDYHDVLEIPQGQVGIVEAKDGNSLPNGQAYAPRWDSIDQMLDPKAFLTSETGYKGPQSSVLSPGTHVFHPGVFNITTVPATVIAPGEAGVIKSNVGAEPSRDLVVNGIVPRYGANGEEHRGIWDEAMPPQTLYINPNAYYCIKVPTTVAIVDYTASQDNNDEYTQLSLENSIEVKTKDGFKFPIDVRIEYRIEPNSAPTVVSFFYDETTKNVQKKLRQKMNSTVRSVFRNNAENAGALEYINNRSHQETSCFGLITSEMESFGITITKVAIGDIDPRSESEELSALLKTQTDKQIALQQELTYVQQQAAAKEEQKLNDEQQRAVEVKRLATADFDAQIAEQEASQQERRALGMANSAKLQADAEAYAIRLKATAEAEGILARQKAEAEGYREKADAIGGSNLAMIELFERISTGGISITPDIVVGGSGEGGSGGTINGMFALMIQRMMEDSNTGKSAWKPRENTVEIE